MNNYSSAYQRRNMQGMSNYSIKENYTTCMTALPDDTVVAMAYVPFQTDTSTYDEMQALKCGTLYPILYKPFLGSGAR